MIGDGVVKIVKLFWKESDNERWSDGKFVNRGCAIWQLCGFDVSGFRWSTLREVEEWHLGIITVSISNCGRCQDFSTRWILAVFLSPLDRREPLSTRWLRWFSPHSDAVLFQLFHCHA